MSKTFEDTWGDRLQVAEDFGNVYLNNTDVAKDGDRICVDFAFTPEDARRLAKAIKKAAKRAEAAG